MRVLLVEDNTDVRELLVLLLEDEGLIVESADRAETAEILFAAGPFDVVMTDVSLPQMSGTELARRLRALRPDIWIVFASGYAMQPLPTDWGPRVRALQKPFDAEQLHDLMDEIRAARQ